MGYFTVAKVADLEPADLLQAFEYLDDLRDSGETNMMMATPYLEGVVDGWERPQVRSAHIAWMKTFSRDKTPEERVRLAQSEKADA